MAEESSDRAIEQAILATKKGAHLLKCGRRGKPKFCPFRLSTDEKHLIWYSGRKEKQLRLSSVTNIITGQRTQDRECQSFSLIFANGERSLDLICKDKAQADSWFLGLKTVISRYHHSRLFNSGTESCTSSPGYARRKYNLGLLENATGYPQVNSGSVSPTPSISEGSFSDATGYSQVNSVSVSPTPSLSEWSLFDAFTYSSGGFYTYGSGLYPMQHVMNVLAPNSQCVKPKKPEKRESSLGTSELQNNRPGQFLARGFEAQRTQDNDVLKDVMIWGEGIAGGILGGGVDDLGSDNKKRADAFLPKVLESTVMLDVHSVSLGGKHAGLVTKRGEVFCWGKGNRGRLGNKVNLDTREPKIVDSLDGVCVKSIACGEYQTCALTSSGELYTWGDNGCGERGRNHWWPHKLSGPLEGITITSVACGEWHTAIVSNSGELFTYGDGTFGALGHGDLETVSQPKEVKSLKGLTVKSIACGSWHTAAIVEIMVHRTNGNNTTGKLFTWGDGDRGRLGHDDKEKKLSPTCVARLVDHDFVQVSCGRMMTVALTGLGVVYTMGSAVHGQLGNPHAKDRLVTVVEGKLKDEFVKEISSGSYHVAVLTSSKRVYTWGKGQNGQLGLGDSEDRNSPTCVEALRGTEVESIACGSNVTAAICLHKPVSVSDQATCKGCKSPFGFARKKHNCYNCGLLFCSSCSSKKVSNSSLAPNKSKLTRVCDPCFDHLQRLAHPWRQWKLENQSPRPRLLTHMPSSDDCGEESQSREMKNLRTRGEKQQREERVSCLSDGTPRWGQVQCPSLFEMDLSKRDTSLAPFFSDQLSEHSVSSTMKAESDRMVSAEVQRLRAEVRILEKQCEIGSRKLQECQETIEEAWSVAKDEAAKCKAAKEIIKALALQLHTMSDKTSTQRLPKHGASMSQITPIRTKSSDCEDVACTPLFEHGCIPRTDQSQQNETEVPNNHERVEQLQYEPGVYITLTNLPNGHKGLKRVRFSKKRYSEKEAARWWEENQAAVYQKYDIVEG